jgi:hypothetical protein
MTINAFGILIGVDGCQIDRSGRLGPSKKCALWLGVTGGAEGIVLFLICCEQHPTRGKQKAKDQDDWQAKAKVTRERSMDFP